MIESLHQQAHQQNPNTIQHQQVISGTNINVFKLKPPHCVNTSSTLLSPALYNTSTSSIENLPPHENSLYQSATASRANVGCGKAVSFSRAVSQGAYIIPTQSSTSIGSSASSRVPLATLQRNSRSYNMPQNNQISPNNYDIKSDNCLEESYMEQDENNSAQKSQVFQLYPNTSEHQNPSPSSVGVPSSESNVNSTHFKPPAAKKIKLRDSWSR